MDANVNVNSTSILANKNVLMVKIKINARMEYVVRIIKRTPIVLIHNSLMKWQDVYFKINNNNSLA